MHQFDSLLAILQGWYPPQLFLPLTEATTGEDSHCPKAQVPGAAGELPAQGVAATWLPTIRTPWAETAGTWHEASS